MYVPHFEKYKLDQLGPAWVHDNPWVRDAQWLALPDLCMTDECPQILVSPDFLGLYHLKPSSGIPACGPILTGPPGVGQGFACTPSGSFVKMQILIQ